MRLGRLRLELGVELHGQEPGMVGLLDDLDDRAVGARAGGDEAVLLEVLPIGVVELVAMAVPFVDLVGRRRPGAPGCRARGRRATSPAASCRRARGPTAVPPSAQITGCWVVLSNSVLLASSRPEHVAGELDDGALHAQADAEERDALACGRSGSPRSCPRSRACRSRRGRGCRRRRPGSPRAAGCRPPRPRPARRARVARLAIPAWSSASYTDL